MCFLTLPAVSAHLQPQVLVAGWSVLQQFDDPAYQRGLVPGEDSHVLSGQVLQLAVLLTAQLHQDGLSAATSTTTSLTQPLINAPLH